MTLYNNPVRNRDVVSWDQRVRIADGVSEDDGEVTITIPDDLPSVEDNSVWYLRVDTSLLEAPQVISLHPFVDVGLTRSRCRVCLTPLDRLRFETRTGLGYMGPYAAARIIMGERVPDRIKCI